MILSKFRPVCESHQMSDFASLQPSSLSGSISGSISSQRSYGATRSNLDYADTKFFTHKLERGDTLQRISVKYGVAVEKLKRVNKIWSNESLFLLQTIKIPFTKQPAKWEDGSDDDDDDNENTDSNFDKTEDGVVSHEEVNINCQEVKKKDNKDIVENGEEKIEDSKDFFSMIDNRISECKKEWTKIRSHSQNHEVPFVSYDSTDANKMSPTKRYQAFTNENI